MKTKVARAFTMTPSCSGSNTVWVPQGNGCLIIDLDKKRNIVRLYMTDDMLKDPRVRKFKGYVKISIPHNRVRQLRSMLKHKETSGWANVSRLLKRDINESRTD